MTRLAMRLAPFVLLIAPLGAAGCGSNGSSPPSSLITATVENQTRGGFVTVSTVTPVFDPSNYVPNVTHPYLPLVPGTISRFASSSEAIEVEVLRERKTILGVQTTVVHDRVFASGSLIEDTLDWYAQDREGNVWYLGEDSKSYQNGVVVSTKGSWEAGVNGAQAGIVMLAHPKIGDRYQQEFSAGVAEDMASIKSLDQNVTVPYGTFDHCVQTMEFTPLSPGNRGYKYYAAGVGLVLEVTPRGGQDRVELVSVTP